MNLQIWDGPLKCILKIFFMDSDVWLGLNLLFQVSGNVHLEKSKKFDYVYGNSLNKINVVLKQPGIKMQNINV